MYILYLKLMLKDKDGWYTITALSCPAHSHHSIIAVIMSSEAPKFGFNLSGVCLHLAAQSKCGALQTGWSPRGPRCTSGSCRSTLLGQRRFRRTDALNATTHTHTHTHTSYIHVCMHLIIKLQKSVLCFYQMVILRYWMNTVSIYHDIYLILQCISKNILVLPWQH